MTNNTAQRVRVLVVDDSALMRQLMAEILSREPGIELSERLLILMMHGRRSNAWNRM